jgi:hypothetical protein
MPLSTKAVNNINPICDILLAFNAIANTAPVSYPFATRQKGESMAARKPSRPPERQPLVTTSVILPLDLFNALESAAREKARRIRAQNARLPKGQKVGSSRPSVSAVIVAVLEAHRDEIESIASGESE